MNEVSVSKEEFTTRMKQLIEIAKRDPEYTHSAADDILCHCLYVNGFTELVDLYHEIQKWYA